MALLHGRLRGGGARAPRQPGGEAASQPGAFFIDAPIGRDPARAGRVTCDATAVGAKLAQALAPLLNLNLTLTLARALALTPSLTLSLARAFPPTTDPYPDPDPNLDPNPDPYPDLNP